MVKSTGKTALQLEEWAGKRRNRGDGNGAARLYAAAATQYTADGNLQKAAGCLHMVGVCYKIENNLEHAMRAYAEAIEAYKRAGDPMGEGRVLRDMGIMLEYHDQLPQALEHLNKSVQMLSVLPDDSHKQGVHEAVLRNAELGISHVKRGLILTRLRRDQEALLAFGRGLHLIRSAGHPFYELTALMHLAQYFWRQGNGEHMLTHIQASIGVLHEFGLYKEHGRRLIQLHGLMAHAQKLCGNAVAARHFAKLALTALAKLSREAQTPLAKDISVDTLRELAK